MSLVLEKLGKLDEAVSMLENVVETQSARAVTDEIVSQHHLKKRMTAIQHNQTNLDILRAKQHQAIQHASSAHGSVPRQGLRPDLQVAQSTQIGALQEEGVPPGSQPIEGSPTT
jgi:hypothetical protein